MTIIARESWLNCDLNFRLTCTGAIHYLFLAGTFSTRKSERVEEDSFNSIAGAFIAGNNITYQFEVQEMLYEAKNAACKPSVLSKEGNLKTHADLRPLEL